MKSSSLLESLLNQTKTISQAALRLETLSEELLNWRANADSWTILECLEHLNLYGDFYLPAMAAKLAHHKTKPTEHFKPGWLGNYFATSMLANGKIKKMKTFKSKNPIGRTLDRQTITRFLLQQRELEELLILAQNANLSSIRVATTLSPWLRFKLGDTFRFFIYHIQRHFVQIDKILAQAQRR